MSMTRRGFVVGVAIAGAGWTRTAGAATKTFSKAELRTKIEQFIAYFNKTMAKPFRSAVLILKSEEPLVRQVESGGRFWLCAASEIDSTVGWRSSNR